MTTQEFNEWLREAIDIAREDDEGTGVRRVETFEDAGVLTTNAGLVVTLDDGTEFQVTVVRSRRGRGRTEENDE